MDDALLLGVPFSSKKWKPGQSLYAYAANHIREIFEFDDDASYHAERHCWCEAEVGESMGIPSDAYRFKPGHLIVRFDPNKGLVLNTSCPACHGEDPGCPMCHPPKKD